MSFKIWLTISLLLIAASALAAGYYFEKPLWPAPAGNARMLIYDPAVNADKNVTWEQMRAVFENGSAAARTARHEAETTGAHGGIVANTDPRLSDARTPLAHNQAAATITGLAAVATSGSYQDLINQPIFTRGYDGREIELQTSATHIQWRYFGDTAWNNLAPLPVDGAAGVDGKTILSGSGAPGNGLGTNGDFYLDTATAHLYGPKAAGVWPGTYTELVGPQGIQGPEGPPGALPNQAAIFGVIDDPIDGATMWLQQGDTEQVTNAKDGVKDRLGNAKTWRDANGTVVRQCITGDTAPAFKMLAPNGTVLYTVSCDSTMTFSGTVTIK